MPSLPKITIATSNPGKLRDFQAAAIALKITVEPLPGFASLPPAVESGTTFEQNARIKAEHYSRAAPGELVLADDSGLEVDALNGAPGVHSARYAALSHGNSEAYKNSGDRENNRYLVSQLEGVERELRWGRFVCVIAAARDGITMHTFRGEARGELLAAPRGSQGFGYDPLFFFPALGKTFAELSGEEKAEHSHRGQAFRRFLSWYSNGGNSAEQSAGDPVFRLKRLK